MKYIWTAVARLADDKNGQDLLEYGLLAALIAVVVMVGVTAAGQQINTVLWKAIAQNF